MQIVRKMEPFSAVPTTGRTVLNSQLVLGNVVERFYLVLTGGAFTKAMITALRVKLNGKVIFGDVSGTILDLIQRYTLLNNTEGFLTVDFTEPVARSIQGQLMGAINTTAAGVTDFTIEVDVAGATTPALDAWVQLRTPDSMSPANGFNPKLSPLIRALIPTTLTPNSTAETNFGVNIGSGGSSLIKRLYISSTVLTSFRAKRDSIDIFETVAISLNTYMQLDYGRVAQTNLYVYDPLVDGNQSDAIYTRRPDESAANFQWLFTQSGAGTHFVFADAYSTLGAL